ncbi:MAG: type II toxin-antitoxin system VapC family toxin [bacterium]|nr:type II toxin-antitoxin system VapC family toxin [bacterium]
MIVVDSCGWLEYFSNGSLADAYAEYLIDHSEIVTPSIIHYEIFKVMKQQANEEAAFMAIAQINKTKIIPLTDDIALMAADVHLRHSLPMADAIIYATAGYAGADIVTSDAHFENLPGVIYLKKR